MGKSEAKNKVTLKAPLSRAKNALNRLKSSINYNFSQDGRLKKTGSARFSHV